MGHNFTYKNRKEFTCTEVKGVHKAKNMQNIDVTLFTINKRQFYFSLYIY